MLQEWISWGGSMKWVKTKWPVAGISLKSVNSGSLLPTVVGDQLPRLEMLMTEWHCSDLEVPLRPRRRLALFFLSHSAREHGTYVGKDSFFLTSRCYPWFLSPTEKVPPHTHLKKTSLSQWKIGQLDFKIFTFPLLIKKKKQDKIFLFYVSGFFFLSDSHIPVSIQNSLHESRDHVYSLIL